MTGDWRNGKTEELYDLYCSPRIVVLVTKSRKVRWSGHVTHITVLWWGKRPI